MKFWRGKHILVFILLWKNSHLLQSEFLNEVMCMKLWSTMQMLDVTVMKSLWLLRGWHGPCSHKELDMTEYTYTFIFNCAFYPHHSSLLSVFFSLQQRGIFENYTSWVPLPILCLVCSVNLSSVVPKQGKGRKSNSPSLCFRMNLQQWLFFHDSSPFYNRQP